MDAVIKVLATIAILAIMLVLAISFLGKGKTKKPSSSTSDEVCKRGVLHYQDRHGRLTPALKLDWSLHSCGAEMTLTAAKLNYNSYVF